MTRRECCLLLLMLSILLHKTAAVVPIQINGKPLPSTHVIQEQTFNDPVQLEIRSSSAVHDGLVRGDGTFRLFEFIAPDVIIANVTFWDGYTSNYGGCVLLQKVTYVHVINSHFVGCIAGQSGGGIFMFPTNQLLFKLQSSYFQDMWNTASTIDSYDMLSIASGGAAGAVLTGASHFSEILIEDVIVSNAHVCITFDSNIGTVSSFGGAFWFAWPSPFSGDGVKTNIHNLTVSNASILWEVMDTSQSLIRANSITTGLAVLMLFNGSSSGKEVLLNVSDIQIINCSISGNAYDAMEIVGIGAVWSREASGENFHLEARSNIVLMNNNFGQKYQTFGGIWRGPSSGTDSQLSLSEGNIFVFDTNFFSNSAFASLLLLGANSGERMEATISNMPMTIQDCHFSYASFIQIGCEGDYSGNHAHIDINRNTTVVIANTTFSKGSALFRLFTVGNESGNGAYMTASEAQILVFKSSIGHESAIFYATWNADASGNFAELTFTDNAILHVSDVVMGHEAAVILLKWYGSSSGNNSRNIFLRQSTLKCESAFLDKDAALLFMALYGYERPGFAQIIMTSSFLVCTNVDFSNSANVVGIIGAGTSSGHITLSSMRISLFRCTFYLGGAYYVSFWDAGGGEHAKVEIVNNSEIIAEACTFNYSNVVFVSFGPHSHILHSSGYRSSLVVSDSFLNIHGDTTFEELSSVFGLSWKAEGQGEITVNISNVTVDVTCLAGTVTFSIFQVFSPGPNFQMNLHDVKGTIHAVPTNAKFLYIYASSSGGRVDIANVTIYDSQMDKLLYVIISSLEEVSVSITELHVLNSSANVLEIAVPSPPDGSAVIVSNATVFFYECYFINSSAILVQTYVPDASVGKLSFNVTQINICNGGPVELMSLSSAGSKLLNDIMIDNIVASDAKLKLFENDSGGGVVHIKQVHAYGCIINDYLISISLFFRHSVQSTLQLSNIFAHDVVIASGASMLRSEGNVSIIFSEDIEFLSNVSSSAAPMILFGKTNAAPAVLDEDNFRPLFAVNRRGGVEPRASLKLLELKPQFVPSLHNLFVTAEYDRQTTVISDIQFTWPRVFLCPPGFIFNYQATVSLQFALVNTVPPYNCLNVYENTTNSCKDPVVSASASCVACPYGTISFFRGSSYNLSEDRKGHSFIKLSSMPFANCQQCHLSMRCDRGPADAVIVRGYWSFHLPELWQVANWSTYTLQDLVVQCPSSNCDPVEELTYVDGKWKPGTGLCSSGLDEKSPLCSRCLEGASLNVFRSGCTKGCTWNGFNVMFICGIVVVILAYIVYLLARPVTAQSAWVSVVAYYYSCLDVLFSASPTDPKGVVVQIATVLTTFSFPTIDSQPLNSTAGAQTSLCLPGLQPVHLRVLQAALPFCVAFFFFLVGVMLRARLCYCKRRDLWNERRNSLIAGAFTVVMLCYSSMAGAIFLFFSCVPIYIPDIANGSFSRELRLFADAASPCWTFNPAYVLLMVLGLGLIFIVPVGLFVWQALYPANERDRILYRIDRYLAQRRYMRNRVLEPQRRCWCLRRWRGVTILVYLETSTRVWWWHSYLLLSRIILEGISVFSPKGLLQQTVFFGANLFFLLVHSIVRPYHSTLVNAFNILCQMILLTVNALGFLGAFVLELPFTSAAYSSQLKEIENGRTWLAFIGCIALLIAIIGHLLYKLYRHLQTRPASPVQWLVERGRRFFVRQTPQGMELRANLLPVQR